MRKILAAALVLGAATAANALLTGEVDWLEMPMPDLLPMLRKSSDVVLGRLDDWGFISQLRPNHLNPFTDNAAFRRALLAAMDQREVLDEIMGEDTDGTRTPMGYLATGKPEVDLAGIEAITKRKSPDDVKRMLKDAGYNGEKLVLLHTSDQPFYNAASLVVVDTMRKMRAYLTRLFSHGPVVKPSLMEA